MTNGFDRIYNYCVNGPNSSLLIFGKRSNEILKKMYERALEEGHNLSWVEKPENVEDFCTHISLGNIKYHDYDSIKEYVKLLKESEKRQHTFIPDFDEILYLFDFEKKLSVNKLLNELWVGTRGVFRMYGTYGNSVSDYMKNTLSGNEFFLRKENFASIEDRYLI